jgi:AcrR family transcriptional regulator
MQNFVPCTFIGTLQHMTTTAPSPGLRERKKQKTRETITKVAMDLFAERGYEETTIADIAEAAEVSPRTIFAYFPSKEDILFCDLPEKQDRLARALRERPDGATTLDVLREFIAGSLTPDRNLLLRKRILASNETLQRNERARFGPFEQLMHESIAEDLNADPDDIRPQIVAAALIAAFSAVVERNNAAPPESYSAEQAMAVVDDVMRFLRGGLDAFRQH